MGASQVQQPPFPTLAGKVAIVTGASRGIGRGIASELARRGAKVSAFSYAQPGICQEVEMVLTKIATDTNQVAAVYVSSNSGKAVDELTAEIEGFGNGAECVGVQSDLKDPACGINIVKQTVAAFGDKVDILVNNAGVDLVKPISDIKVEDFDAVYHVNVRAPLLVLQAVLPHLRSPGRIINIGSVASRNGFKGVSVYGSSKSALEGFTRCWAGELGVDGTTVNTVNVGPVQSDMLANFPKELIEMQKSVTPVENRLGTFDDVAQIVAWLASEESRWITGQTISASGGFDMY